MIPIYVIIPVYNAEKYIEQAVGSVLCQKYDAMHIILVNDGSTDDSRNICDRLVQNHDCISVIHQENGGVSCARNAGIAYALAHAEDEDGFIGFCDADDLWKRDCVSQEILENAVEQNADILGFSCWCTDQDAKRYHVGNQYRQHIDRFQETGTTNWILNGPFCAHLYSMRLLKRFALCFPENVRRNEDVIFMRQAVFCATCIVYREEPLYLYRTNGNSVTH